MWWRATIVVIATSLVAGCGATGSGPSAPDASVDAPPAHEVVGEPLEEGDSEVADAVALPMPGQADVEAVPWDLVEWVEGDVIGFQFRSRGAPCEVLDRVEVHEDGERVTATLYVGRDPSVPPDDPRCEDLPILTLRAEVTLDAWDGCRTYVDGADGSSVSTC